MATPRSTRRLVPTPGGLSLEGPHAQADLEWLGWMNPDSVELLWSLTGAADPDLALNTLVRLMQALTSHLSFLKCQSNFAKGSKCFSGMFLTIHRFNRLNQCPKSVCFT